MGCYLAIEKKKTIDIGKNMHESQNFMLNERSLKRKSTYSATSLTYYEKRKFWDRHQISSVRAATRESTSTAKERTFRCWLSSALLLWWLHDFIHLLKLIKS